MDPFAEYPAQSGLGYLSRRAHLAEAGLSTLDLWLSLSSLYHGVRPTFGRGGDQCILVGCLMSAVAAVVGS